MIQIRLDEAIVLARTATRFAFNVAFVFGTPYAYARVSMLDYSGSEVARLDVELSEDDLKEWGEDDGVLAAVVAAKVRAHYSEQPE
jgi:hypothetical protein